MTRTLRRILPALTLLAALTACGTTTSSDPAPAPKHQATTTTTTRDETAVIVDLAWANQTDEDKANMCAGIALFGTDWAADKMRQGAGGSDAVDWQRAAILVQAKCEDL